MEQAYDLGVSSERDINSLVPGSVINLEGEWEEFLAQNSDFNDGSFDDNLDVMSQEPIDLRQLIVDALGSLACQELWRQATIGDMYSRKYEVGSEGTGFHTDGSTNYDLFVVHTLFGRAEFGAVGRNGTHFNQDMIPGSVIAFRADTLHFAGPPIAGERKIEGAPIKLDGDLNNCSVVVQEFG